MTVTNMYFEREECMIENMFQTCQKCRIHDRRYRYSQREDMGLGRKVLIKGRRHDRENVYF